MQLGVKLVIQCAVKLLFFCAESNLFRANLHNFGFILVVAKLKGQIST
jgi:hypothetical protein